MHLARHTFATTITLSQGISIEAVSKMLGHTTLKHTQLYAKIVNTKVKAEMEKLKDSFGNFLKIPEILAAGLYPIGYNPAAYFVFIPNQV
jgi:hypothetical protein